MDYFIMDNKNKIIDYCLKKYRVDITDNLRMLLRKYLEQDSDVLHGIFCTYTELISSCVDIEILYDFAVDLAYQI